MATAPQIPGILTEQEPDPVGNQVGVAARLSAALQGSQGAPQLGPQAVAPHAGMLKQFLTNYFGTVAAHLSGMPSPYLQKREEQELANATLQAKSKAALENSQAGYYSGKNSTTENVADIKASPLLAGVNQKMADSGYEMVMGQDGQPVRQPIPPERLSEKAKASLAFEGAKAEYNKAAALNQQAQADVRNNPNSPGFRQKADQIAAQLAMAQQKLLLAVTSQNRQDAQFQINNGVTTSGAPATIQGNGQAVDDNMRPIGKNFQGINTPTAATRTAGEQGQIISRNGAGLISYIDAHRHELGSMDAILNVAFSHTPAANPVQAEAASRVASFAALQPRMHGLRGKAAQDEFKALIGPNYNNPDAMIGGIKGMTGTAADVSAVATPRTNVNQANRDPLGILK